MIYFGVSRNLGRLSDGWKRRKYQNGVCHGSFARGCRYYSLFSLWGQISFLRRNCLYINDMRSNKRVRYCAATGYNVLATAFPLSLKDGSKIFQKPHKTGHRQASSRVICLGLGSLPSSVVASDGLVLGRGEVIRDAILAREEAMAAPVADERTPDDPGQPCQLRSNTKAIKMVPERMPVNKAQNIQIRLARRRERDSRGKSTFPKKLMIGPSFFTVCQLLITSIRRYESWTACQWELGSGFRTLPRNPKPN